MSDKNNEEKIIAIIVCGLIPLAIPAISYIYAIFHYIHKVNIFIHFLGIFCIYWFIKLIFEILNLYPQIKKFIINIFIKILAAYLVITFLIGLGIEIYLLNEYLKH